MKHFSLKILLVLMAVALLMAGCASSPKPAPPPPPPPPAPAPAPTPQPMGPMSQDPMGDLKKGGIAVECHQFEMAVDLLSGVINAGGISDKDMAKAYNLRGLAYTWLKDCDKALADYNKAIEMWPNYDAAYYNRGMTHMQCGDMAAGNADLAMARKMNYNETPGPVRTMCPKY